jgi:two-component system, OmpR family, sensor kinase
LRFDTLRNRLVLLIFLITAAAIGFVYLYVVPQLESSLTAEKLRRLERLGEEQGPSLASALQTGASEEQVRELVRSIGQTTESRVTLLAVRDEGGTPTPDFVIADSLGESTAIQGGYVAADDAAADGEVTSGVDTVAGNRVGTSAVPIEVGDVTEWVAVLSSPLAEVDDNVALIRRQILIAGAIALVGASLVGFWAAGAASRRLRRLRQAAEHVAEGDFSETIPIDSSDELGQLARSFNEMQRHLARLDRARKEFIANASHELRTPIFSLGGFVELLETENPSAAERRAFVAEMRGQIERLQKLTANLLDLSKLDADVMELQRERVDLKELARDIATEFRPAAKHHQSRLEVRGKGQAIALADPDRVAQIIRILLDNALTHTPEGTKVNVTAVSGTKAAELIVGDDGKGLDARALDRVFDRFYSGDTAGGSGLGLAIGHELATRMGGSLKVVSQRGYTAFTLSLPLPRESRPRRRPVEAAA